MAFIGDNGLLFPEPGDILRVEHRLRASSFGKLLGAKPTILVNHLTGNHIPYRCDTSAQDGTKGMAGRVAAGTAKYYAHCYLGRDGIMWQCIPFVRAAIHVAGKWAGQETNRISTGVEWTNLGYVDATTGVGPGFKTDPARPDLRRHDGQAWQMLSEPQCSAFLDFVGAWRDWTGARVIDCLRGHHDVDADSSHIDPGPELRAYLDTVVRAHLVGTK